MQCVAVANMGEELVILFTGFCAQHRHMASSSDWPLCIEIVFKALDRQTLWSKNGKRDETSTLTVTSQLLRSYCGPLGSTNGRPNVRRLP